MAGSAVLRAQSQMACLIAPAAKLWRASALIPVILAEPVNEALNSDLYRRSWPVADTSDQILVPSSRNALWATGEGVGQIGDIQDSGARS